MGAISIVWLRDRGKRRELFILIHPFRNGTRMNHMLAYTNISDPTSSPCTVLHSLPALYCTISRSHYNISV